MVLRKVIRQVPLHPVIRWERAICHREWEESYMERGTEHPGLLFCMIM